jgi:hypothetical protein
MITTCKTQQHIIKAMEKGAELVFHIGTDGEGATYIRRVTLEHNGKELKLSANHRDDEAYWDDYHESYRLRCGEHSQPESAADVANRVIKCPEIRSEYAGYRGDRHWRELYVHNNQPVPLWVTEQWGDERW